MVCISLIFSAIICSIVLHFYFGIKRDVKKLKKENEKLKELTYVGFEELEEVIEKRKKLGYDNTTFCIEKDSLIIGHTFEHYSGYSRFVKDYNNIKEANEALDKEIEKRLRLIEQEQQKLLS